jgi:hypothetical protein
MDLVDHGRMLLIYAELERRCPTGSLVDTQQRLISQRDLPTNLPGNECAGCSVGISPIRLAITCHLCMWLGPGQMTCSCILGSGWKDNLVDPGKWHSYTNLVPKGFSQRCTEQ